MSDLSPELQKIVLAGKAASCPTTTDFDRVATALEARLGNIVLPRSEPASGIGSNASVPVASSKVAALTAIGLALVIGGIVLYSSRQGEDSGSSIPAVATVVLPSAGPIEPSHQESTQHSTLHSAPAPLSTATAAQTASARAPGGVRSRQPERDPNRLAEEASLLSRAEAELYRGHPGKSLELLGEHERKFAGGALTEERVAARVQALCALGRVSEAEAQLARLNPSSMHGESSRRACKAPSTTKGK